MKTSYMPRSWNWWRMGDAEIKYSTVQNWYPGDEERQGRNLQLRYQAWRSAAADNSKISWTQVETGSAVTWKYPSCGPAAARIRLVSFIRWH